MYTTDLVLEVETKMPTPEQWANIVKAARYFSKDQIALVWGIGDIIERAKQNKKRIGVKKARKILQDIARNHDCNYGVSWDTLDCYIDNTSDM